MGCLVVGRCVRPEVTVGSTPRCATTDPRVFPVQCVDSLGALVQDCSFPAYFYTQPMATGPGFYDNLCPQSWQDGSAATFTLQDPHQQTFDCPGN